MKNKLLIHALILGSVLISTTLATPTASAASKKKSCALFVQAPSITYSRADGLILQADAGSNPVGSPVLALLQMKGFAITQSPSRKGYEMHTEVRCGPTPMGDACQTQVRFVNASSFQNVFTSPITQPQLGMNINFNSITFPTCKELP